MLTKLLLHVKLGVVEGGAAEVQTGDGADLRSSMSPPIGKGHACHFHRQFQITLRRVHVITFVLYFT